MKRLALVLAAAVFGAGCGSSHSAPPPPPSGTVDIAWSFVRTLNDGAGTQVTYDCSTSGLGIDTVVVDAVGAGSVALPCADNAGTGGAIALAPGTYSLVVTAYRGGAGGVALFNHQFDGVNVAVNATTHINPAPLDAIFAPLQLDVDFVDINGNPFATCLSAGVSSFTVDLFDSHGMNVYASPSISCSSPLPDSILFDSNSAVGPVDLDTYTIRVQGGNGTFVFDSSVSPNCLVPAFHHYGADVGANAWSVAAYDVTGRALCP